MAVMIFDNPQQVAREFASDFARLVDETPGLINVSLSGGTTPKLLFEYWASPSSPPVDWKRIHFFWGDERCVPADDPDSNFGVANSLFFQPASIPAENIHRVRGEEDPGSERIRYSQVIKDLVPRQNGLPVFDFMILGMGGDGHTASIFPNQFSLLDSNDICEIATHPDSGQLRITLTGPVIANADRVIFLITGDSKAEKVSAIRQRSPESKLWPATRFFHLPTTSIYLDRAAALQD